MKPAGAENGTGRLEGLEIRDMAPTILNLFGLPIPADMEGKVISAAPPLQELTVDHHN
jgi:bisphosphoglycerate-independent phosphoglycerate mutase (AlkP superfamily)